MKASPQLCIPKKMYFLCPIKTLHIALHTEMATSPQVGASGGMSVVSRDVTTYSKQIDLFFKNYPNQKNAISPIAGINESNNQGMGVAPLTLNLKTIHRVPIPLLGILNSSSLGVYSSSRVVFPPWTARCCPIESYGHYLLLWAPCH